MASISNTGSISGKLSGLAKAPSQHACAQSLLAATVGLMSLKTPMIPSNSSSEAQDATAMDRFSANERITVMNRAAAAVLPPACRSFSSHTCEETEAPLPTPGLPLRKLHTQDYIEPVISTKNFPETLLEVVSSGRYPDIISWLPHGRGFVILDKERFTSLILPRYFDGAKFPSFTRRMKRWNFVRVPRGPDMGAYFHKKFVRDRPDLVREMTYGAGGKFEKKKKKEGEKAGENKRVQHSLSNGVHNDPLNDAPRDLPRGLPREEKYFKPQNQSAIPKMDTWHPVDPQEQPMPLPSTLPQNKTPKPSVAQKETAVDAMGHRAKNATVAATIHKNMEWLENHADLLWPSSCPTSPPRSQTPLGLRQRRIAEIEQELLLARSILSRQVPDYLSSSRPISATGTRSMTEGSLSNHRPYHASEIIDTQIMTEIQRAKRILEAEAVMRDCNRLRHAPTVSSNRIQSSKSTSNDNRMRSVIAPEIQASSKIQRDAADAVLRELQLILKPSLTPQNNSSGRTMAEALGRRRPVVMSRKEEAKLLARYLASRRNV